MEGVQAGAPIALEFEPDVEFPRPVFIGAGDVVGVTVTRLPPFSTDKTGCAEVADKEAGDESGADVEVWGATVTLTLVIEVVVQTGMIDLPVVVSDVAEVEDDEDVSCLGKMVA